MKETLVSELISLTNEYKIWDTRLIVPHNGSNVDISSAAMGKASTVPINASDQPLKYPLLSKYRFDTKFQGIEAIDALKDMLKDFKCCPGCDVPTKQSGSRTSANRGGNWTLACSHGRLSENMEKKQFLNGEMKMTNTIEQTLKKKKGTKSTYKGLYNMYSKTTRKSLREELQITENDDSKKQVSKPAMNRRTMGVRPDDKAKKCPMKLVIFYDTWDKYFYLSTSTNLEHTGHPYIEQGARVRNENDLNDDDKKLLETLYSLRASNHMISKIFEELKGKDFGTFIPKTIYNMNAKSQKMLDVANGITSDMSDAEKALKQLEMYVILTVTMIILSSTLY